MININFPYQQIGISIQKSWIKLSKFFRLPTSAELICSAWKNCRQKLSSVVRRSGQKTQADDYALSILVVVVERVNGLFKVKQRLKPP